MRLDESNIALLAGETGMNTRCCTTHTSMTEQNVAHEGRANNEYTTTTSSPCHVLSHVAPFLIQEQSKSIFSRFHVVKRHAYHLLSTLRLRRPCVGNYRSAVPSDPRAPNLSTIFHHNPHSLVQLEDVNLCEPFIICVLDGTV